MSVTVIGRLRDSADVGEEAGRGISIMDVLHPYPHHVHLTILDEEEDDYATPDIVDGLSTARLLLVECDMRKDIHHLGVALVTTVDRIQVIVEGQPGDEDLLQVPYGDGRPALASETVTFDGKPDDAARDSYARLRARYRHVAIALGMTGDMRCYVDIDLDEAHRRYGADDGYECPRGRIVGFDDAVSVYDIG